MKPVCHSGVKLFHGPGLSFPQSRHQGFLGRLFDQNGTSSHRDQTLLQRAPVHAYTAGPPSPMGAIWLAVPPHCGGVALGG